MSSSRPLRTSSSLARPEPAAKSISPSRPPLEDRPAAGDEFGVVHREQVVELRLVEAAQERRQGVGAISAVVVERPERLDVLLAPDERQFRSVFAADRRPDAEFS